MQTFKFQKLILLIPFILSFLFWGHLFQFAKMEIIFDAIGYERLGEMFASGNWVKFFETGTHREIFYPVVISFSMVIGKLLSVDYQIIQKIIQIFTLFSTQLLTLGILKKLKVNPILIALTILYIGFSPALINSTFSLFSEIITYPLVLGVVIICAKSAVSIQKSQFKKTILFSIVLGILFILVTSVKSIFEYVAFIFALPFLCIGLKALLSKRGKVILNTLLFLLIFLVSTNVYTYTIKSLNYKYNGKFAFSGRGPWMFYASCEKRMSALSSKRFLAFLANIPGHRICYSLFGPEECSYWSSEKDSGIGSQKIGELRGQGVTHTDMDSKLMSLSVEHILSNPLRYSFFCILEGMKMLFWESTKVGCVTYPLWLERIYDITLFKNLLRLVIFCFTFVALLYFIIYVFRHLKQLHDLNSPENEKMQLCFFTLLMIISVIGFYSLVTILTRFSFSIVPLYLITIGFFLQRVIFNRR